MNFSTTPPYRLIITRAVSKYCDSISRTSSGSRDSASDVDPTRSQNSTEHTRRSATGVTPGEETAAVFSAAPSCAAAPPTARECPHDPQKRLPAVTGSPQAGQPPAGAPQSSQNRLLVYSSDPH